MKTTALATSLLMTSLVGAQTASYAYLDQKAPYSNANASSIPRGPWLTALNRPALGTAFQVSIPKNGWRISSYWYVELTFGTRSPGLVNHELGGVLYSSAEVRVPMRYWGSGFTTLRFPIPNNSTLLGVRFYNQVMIITRCPQCGPWTLVRLSRGGVGIIGR